jgi:hypothetical protein
MPVRLPLLSLAALPLLAACTAEADREQRIRAPAVEVVGEPENCVLVSRIQHTIVHDDYTIDFDMIGNEVFRNTLPNKCPTLGFEESFAYEVSTSQLCDLDHIHVIQSGAAGAGPVCSLGKFVPVRYVEPAG